MSNIVLNSKTYTGGSVVNGIMQWTERSLGLAGLFSWVRSQLRTTDRVRPRWTLRLPYPTPEGAAACCGPEQTRSADADINVRLDLDLSLAERTDFADRLQALVASAQFRASIIQLEQQT